MTSVQDAACSVSPRATAGTRRGAAGAAGALCAIGWTAGVAVQLQQAALQAPAAAGAWAGIALGALVLALAAWAQAGSTGARRALAVLLLVAAAAGGWAVTEWRAAQRLADTLPRALDGADVQVVGVVTSLPVRRAQGTRFVFTLESAQWQGRELVPGRDVAADVSAGWYADAGEAPVPVQAGERWRFTLRLRPVAGSLNPHGFDYELWMFEQGLRVSASVRTARGVVPPERLGLTWQAPVQRLREALRRGIVRQVGDGPQADLLAALVVGDQAAISRSDWEVFRITGVAHLVAISGLHITLLAWWGGAIWSRVWRLWPAAMLAWPAPVAARWAGLAVALAYSVLAGWGVPAQRTVLMLGVATLLRSGGLRWSGPRVLAASGWAVVLADPWALLQPGFWLSFVAVGLLMLSDGHAGARPGGAGTQAAWADPQAPASGSVAGVAGEGSAVAGWRGRLGVAVRALGDAARAGWRSQWVASVGLAPWTLLFFQQLSLVGLLANLWAIPLVTLIVTPLGLLGCVLPPAWSLAAWAVDGMRALLAGMAAWPLASWSAPVAPAWAQGAAVLGAGWLVLPLPWRARVPGLLLCLPLLWPARDLPPPGHVDLLAADVGQGSAVLVRTRTHALLFDAGAQYSPDADAGTRVLQPLLRALGVERLDLLVLSHRDTDHVGGAAAVLRQPGAWRVLSALPPDHEVRTSMVHQPCVAGMHWVWDGVHFEVLHPRSPQERAVRRANAVSCVLKVSSATGHTALLTGDIEREQEVSLVAQDGLGQLSLHADVLLVPHHGSRTSSSPEFLAAVAPRWAVAQLGRHNRYGHPAPEVEQRYRDAGITWVRTDQCGAWHWQSAHASPWCERVRSARYWHAPAWGVGPDIAKDDSH